MFHKRPLVMNVNPLTVGPILGVTTPTMVRIWGRGTFEVADGRPRRCVGVARVRRVGSSAYDQPLFFPLNPSFDMTGLTMFTDLQPEQEYEYQAGYLFSELDLTTLNPAESFEWESIETYRFRTGAADPMRPRSFVFGSCRYLLKLFGGAWFDQRGDKVFRSMLAQVQSGLQTDAVLMLGDQIYADDLGSIAPDQLPDEYNGRYRTVFTQPYIRGLMARVPTYMTLDDHEIEDSWPAGATQKDWMVKYPAAMHAYLTYQASHSPLYAMEIPGQLIGTPEKLWYSFSDGCCEFFVTDTRTERFLGADLAESEIISQKQMEALKNWLADGSERIKFVASSVPLFPDSLLKTGDQWSGFPQQQGELLDFIRRERPRKTVFLSGDLHAAVTVELISPDTPDFRLLSIVSSPFFWPYPHSSWGKLRLRGPLTTTSSATYELVNSSPVRIDDCFTRVTVNPEQLRADLYSRKGSLLQTTGYEF